MRRQVHGILLLDKPIDITSNAALQKVKRLFSAKKAGHTGSLDPLATGMLPLCFGEATKFSQFLLESDKTYHVVVKLGVQTTTGDAEGEVVATAPVVDVTTDRIEQVMKTFLGEIEQVPPMYSAIKHQGKPLYELARRGIEVAREPRRIRIFSIKLEQLKQDECTFSVHCSKGTYIRTLAEDIGRALGCGGHVIALRRLTVMPYGNAQMYTLSTLEAIAETTGYEGLAACLLPVETAVQVYPAVKLSTSAAFYLRMGQPVRAPFTLDTPLVRLLTEDARFLGVGEVMSDGRVKPHRLLSSPNSATAIAS
ncbi:tRNA pseudouridine(55) synthase TruB [Aquicella lusitana]|uniref:tRNA pseudouridine synthase B n=1 Tax=Aquicella lusitana TaxID=254246 RepID=A0A370GFM0_9COXI|nr:tRNA pseudouridine(55) synthase TruB [Aquicella lusitana]RDI42461.1 tRNA pseudouridine synthase B [Aquicella lusitana]VVC74077.1 tRNA pseudouridine synthase B [Aquicella lusitana]